MPKRLRSYTAGFKLNVVSRSEEIGNRAAAREYGIDEKCVRRWKKEKEQLSAMPTRKKARRYGAVVWPNLEANLYEWVCNQREGGIPISTVKIRLQAKAMAAEMRIENFRGGPSWCYRFMKRKSLSVRTKTTVGQRLPSDWEEKQKSFLQFVHQIILEKNFEASAIINMDEVPLTFDCPPNRTVNATGEKTVSIATTGNEKTSFTCVLACAANGDRLKPLLIFKRKTMPKENFPNGVVIRVNEKGWMNEDIMLSWLQEVWRKRSGAFFKPHGLLIFDSMRSHLGDAVKAACKNASATLAVIPGGLTKKLQPLDLTVNKSFKSQMRKRWENWMSDGMHSFTKTGKMRRAGFSEVAKWVDESWKAVKTETIVSGFKEAGILPSNCDPDDPTNVLDLTDPGNGSDIEDPSNILELDEDMLHLFVSDSEESEFEGFQ